MKKHQTKLFFIFAHAILSIAVSSCSISESLFPEKKTKKRTVVTTTKKPRILSLDVPDPVSDARLVRRLSIDLLNRLPSPEDIRSVTDQKLTAAEIISIYLEKSIAAKVISDRHLRMWNLTTGEVPDLQRYATTDATLSSRLTTETKKHMTAEPTLVLRKLIETNKPFSDLFLLPWSIVHTDVLTVFGDTSSSSPWIGEPYRYLSYSDNRPAMGIFAGRGLNASVDSGQDDSKISHTAELLKRFTCNSFDSISAHLFYDLTAEDFDTGLTTYALSNSKCANCHKQIQRIAPDLTGLSRGQNLSEWQTYSSTTETTASFYSGHTYAGPAELAKLIAKDPRIHVCEIEKLLESYLQRPLYNTREDQILISKMAAAFVNSNESITSAIKTLALSDTYSSEIQDVKVKKKLLGLHSGVKFIQASAWRGILSDLSIETESVDIPASMDTGILDLKDSNTYMPSGTYYHDLNKIARLAATAIVNDELADGRSANTRNLLGNLPDGSGYTTDPAVIDAQIIKVWDRLTSLTLIDSSVEFTALKTLWTAGAATETDPNRKSRKAWQITIIGMMISPEFIMY